LTDLLSRNRRNLFWGLAILCDEIMRM